MNKKVLGLFGSLILLSSCSNFEVTESDLDLSKRDFTSKNGMVVSANPIASKMGLEILKKGGNAVDAAVGVAFTLGLVEPNASGPGGGGFMLIKEKDDFSYYDYYNRAPLNMTLEDWLISNKNGDFKDKGIGCIVPGAVAGWLTALEEHGTMEIDEILEPIIKLAEEGFQVTPTLANMFQDNYEKLTRTESGEKTFLSEGFTYMAGETFKNPYYANTLKLIAKNGKKGFYEGPTAQAIIEANPYITQEDLSTYKPLKLKPLSTDYRGYTVLTTGSSSYGVAILEMLNIVENYDLKKLGLENPELYHIWAEAMNYANIDKYTYVGDTSFEKDYSEILSDQEHANLRNEKINLEKASDIILPEDINKEHGSTTHVSIIDKYGNAVSMTNTIGDFFGNGTSPKNTGFMMNNHANLFSTKYQINDYEPGKRPATGMSPTMVLDPEGNLFLVIGTPGGGRIVTTISLIISNIIDHGMDVQEAIDYPRIEKTGGKLSIEGGVPENIIDSLEKKGHRIVEKNKNDLYFGGAHIIEIDKENHTLTGGADKRRDGKALGY